MKIFHNSPPPGAPGGPELARLKAGLAGTAVTVANACHLHGDHYVSFPKPHRPKFWRRQTPLPVAGRLGRVTTASTHALKAKIEHARDKAEAGLLRLAVRWALRCLWR